MDATVVVSSLRQQLAEAGSPERASTERAYLKSDLEHLGASVPTIRGAARQFVRSHRPLAHDELVAIVAALWAQPVHELRMAAVELMTLEVGLLTPDDLPLLERLVRESRTWALVDGLAANVVGGIDERFPADTTATLERWAADADVWLRRSALLAHLIALRRGAGDFERFGRIADALLDDPEFWIRKAIGWVLRDTSKKRPELVARWLLPRAGRASPLTIREAVKYLSDDDRQAVMAAR